MVYFSLLLYVNLTMTMNPLSSKVHFLAQTRQTKRRTKRKELHHEQTTKSDFGARVSRMRRRFSALPFPGRSPVTQALQVLPDTICKIIRSLPRVCFLNQFLQSPITKSCRLLHHRVRKLDDRTATAHQLTAMGNFFQVAYRSRITYFQNDF